jgi:dTDP-4-dehydrorhamnose reductase
VSAVIALITGAGGQLGRALMAARPAGVHAVALERAALDLADRATLELRLREIRPAVVINAAAYTAVDEAESQPQLAAQVNGTAVGVLATLCSERGIRLVHVSTDFVFDGTASRPYRPDDAPNPINVYGASKLAGERLIAARAGLDWRIVRTAWVYYRSGRNFVATMLRLFRERPLVRVVADQVGTPTSAGSLARCLWQLAQQDGPAEILHFTDAGVASWYDFAVAIGEEARALGLLDRAPAIEPIATEQYPTPARRPAYSVLDKHAIGARLELSPRHWRESLRAELREWGT